MMRTLQQAAVAGRGIALYSGARLDLVAPRAATIRLGDIAQCLARTDASYADAGCYSLAQRAKMLCDLVAREEGALAGCYALLRDAGTALLRSVSPFDICREGLSGVSTRHDLVMTAVHEAVELDWPAPATIGAVLRNLSDRLELRELLTIRHGVEFEIDRLRGQGVQPAPIHIAPKPREKAWLDWCGTWKVMATAAQLRATHAWRGI